MFQKRSRRKLIENIRFYGVAVATYVFFLLTIPSLNELITPCLKPLPAQSYTYAECNISVALDRFLLVSLSGLTVAILFYYFVKARRRLKQLLAFALFLSSLNVIAYYVYIPQVEIRVKTAPIILESLKEAK